MNFTQSMQSLLRHWFWAHGKCTVSVCVCWSLFSSGSVLWCHIRIWTVPADNEWMNNCSQLGQPHHTWAVHESVAMSSWLEALLFK